MACLWQVPREEDLPDVLRESCAGEVDGVDNGKVNGVAEANESSVNSVSRSVE